MKISEERDRFCIDIVNVAVNNGVIEQFAKIRKGSHNRFGGWVTIAYLEEYDEDQSWHKIDTKAVDKALTAISTSYEFDNEDVEKNLLYAIKRNDASILDVDEIAAVVQIASLGCVLEY